MHPFEIVPEKIQNLEKRKQWMQGMVKLTYPLALL